MKKASRAAGIGAVELVEEAVHLLRSAPAGLYAIYAVGTLPFVLAFLYFWADMSRGAFARDHAVQGAADMGLLFLWMKCWQAVFAARLGARITGQPDAPWSARRIGQMALAQICLQPSGLFVMPAALIVLLPAGWVYAFYQNITALGGVSSGLNDTFKTAAQQASVRSGQNYLLQGILTLFFVVVWLNVVMTMAWLPGLLKTLLGIDTAFTQAGKLSVLNTTYLAASFALTYVFVDPLIKAVFVLRCFYGQSLHSGKDLKAELARVRVPTAGMTAIVAALILVGAPGSASAATAEAQTATTNVAPAALSQSIEQVLKKREFAWRMPRQESNESANAPKSWLARMAQAVVDVVREGMKSIGHGLGEALRWIGRMFSKLWPDSASRANASAWSATWVSSLQILLLILIVAIAAFLVVLFIRMWRRRRQPDVVVARAVAARPDLNDENVAADQLPEEGWLKMAAEMMEQGNLRLALRAFYLASLAHLAAREMLAIALFKSNREYETELRRRARALPLVQSAFSENVAAFDRAWYGLHEVTQEALAQFQTNLARIRTC